MLRLMKPAPQKKVRHAMPQGMILGTTIISIDIKGHIISFADDTAVCYKDNSWDSVFYFNISETGIVIK